MLLKFSFMSLETVGRQDCLREQVYMEGARSCSKGASAGKCKQCSGNWYLLGGFLLS